MKLNKYTFVSTVALLAGAIMVQNLQAQSQMPLAAAIELVKQVRAGGEGHESVVAAMSVLNSASKSDIPALLNAMDDAEQPAVNWLRSAIITLTAKDGELPADAVMAYFEDYSHSALGRLAAFELLAVHDESWAATTIPELVDDPSMPLREKGVAAWIEVANEKEGEERLQICRNLFESARDLNQVVVIAEMLEEAGEEVNVQKQLGYLNRWMIMGSFDNKDEAGFDVVHGPENAPGKIDAEASFVGYEGESAVWDPQVTEDSLGLVDLNKCIGPVKGVSAYAATTFISPADQEVEFRIGTPNAHKIWVNGELIMSNEVYHNSDTPDKFSANARLNDGDNVILVKVCQNEQTEEWAQVWQFQLRICDETGKAIEGTCGRH